MLPKGFGKILLIALVLLFLSINPAWAGFGFSPGAVKSDHLFPGSHFEQKIIFSRYSPEGDLRMEVKIDAPGIEDWLSIDRGLSFIFPDGEQQTPMIVSVDVPKDAGYGRYQGFLRTVAIPIGRAREGAVSVMVGGDIRIDLAVTKEEFSDFRVRTFGIAGIERESVKVSIQLENLGNVPVAPSKVYLEVYDQYFNLLHSGDVSNLEKVPAFAVGSTLAEFPFSLEKGYYWGEVEIFKENEVTHSGKVYFEVTEKKFFGKLGEISGGNWVLILGIIVILAIGFGIFWLKFKRRAQRRIK